MLLRMENSPGDGEVHRRNVGFLGAASVATDLPTFIALCGYQSQFDGAEQYFFFPGGPVNPRATMIGDDRTKELLIVLNGMENGDKVQACLNGWSNPVYGGPLVLYPYETAAIAITGGRPSPGIGSRWETLRVVGHSYGGACASYVANLISDVSETCDIKVYTYGAPKSNVGQRRPERITSNTRRVFIHTDPVPQLPITHTDLAALWVLVGTSTARAWSEWRHEVTGLSLPNPSSTALVPTAFSSGEVNGPLGVFSLATWLTGTTAFGADAHSLRSYQTFVNLIAATSRTTAPATQVDRTPVDRPSRHRLETEQAVALAETHQAIAANPQAAAIGIQSGVPIVPGVRYRGLRIRGVHTILYGDTVVESVGTLRVRRAVVRQLNRGLGL
jgi:hypothetical protein